MRLDLHIHSVYSISPIKTSSSSNSLKGIVKYAKLKGLGGFAISDHNNIVANEKIKKLFELKGEVKKKAENKIIKEIVNNQ